MKPWIGGQVLEKSELWPADNPAVTAHITMLQGIITRLAANSASCKTWCLALVGASLSFAAGMHSPALAAFSIVPVLVFAILDSYYLAQERAYRHLYGVIADKIRDGSYARADAFEARAPLQPGAVIGAFASWSILPLYLGLLLAYGAAVWSGWVAMPEAPPAAASNTSVTNASAPAHATALPAPANAVEANASASAR